MFQKRAVAPVAVQSPDPPSDSAADRLPGGALADEGRYEDLAVTDLDLGGQEASHVIVRKARLERVKLIGATLTAIDLMDVALQKCDLANADWTKARAHRVLFDSCRLTGVRLTDAQFEHVLFRECVGNLAQLFAGTLKSVRFEDCRLNEADFRHCDLRGVVFSGCNLEQADFRGAKMAGTDLRGSVIDGIQISGPANVRGAIVELNQAAYLAALQNGLALVVEPVDG